MLRQGWSIRRGGARLAKLARPAFCAVALTFAIAVVIDLLFVPQRNFAALYAVPILVVVWKGSSRGVGVVTALALLADCVSLSGAHVAPMIWPTSLGILVVIGYLSFRMSIQTSRIHRLSTEATCHADRATLASSRLARLQIVTTRLAEARTIEEVAEIAISQGVAALGASAGVLVLLADDHATLSIVGSTGYSKEQLEPWRQIRLDTLTPLTEAVRLGAPVWIESQAELRARYPAIALSPDSLPAKSWSALPLSENGQIIGAIGVSFSEPRSLTAEERMFALTYAGHCAASLSRSRLLAAEQRAQNAAQMALDHRSEFLTVLGHELRTPLTSLRGYAQLVLSRLDDNGTVDPQFVRRAFTVVDRQSAKLARLANQFIDGAGLKTGRLFLQRSRVDVAALTLNAIQLAQGASNHHVFRLTAPESLDAYVDALRIGQVIDNLLENAVRFNPEGGAIDVLLSHVDPHWFEIRVRDYGSGVPLEQRERLFEPFHRAHATDQRSGLGLGLFVGRQIVESHGGKLSTEFPEDGGTRFVVVLPIAPPDRKEGSEPW